MARVNQRTLRQMLIPFFCLAAGVPIIIFAVISQIRLRSNLEAGLENQIQTNINKSDQCLEMVLDKYDTILYDFCTNEEIISAVEQIDNDQYTGAFDASILKKEMADICRQNEGVEGVTVRTDDGSLLFYDRFKDSFEDSTWAYRVNIPDITTGASYGGSITPAKAGNEEVYMFQIARRLVDSRDIKKKIGTVVLSINENIIDHALQTGNQADVYLVQDGKVISSRDNNDIGKDINTIEKGAYWYISTVNKTCGFTIYNGQPLKDYYDTLSEQIIIWILITAAMILVISVISYLLTVPYLREIDLVVDAMNKIEQGDMHARVQESDKMPKEIRRISSGFNEMVEWINALIEKVKRSDAEQKNAELSALEAQIDPHFLYNTLSAINWKAIEKEEFEISEMINALADILRYTIRNPGEPATIGQEMYWLQQYILLQSAKLGKELKINMDVPEELLGCLIHKLLLQPFIENAVRHGLKSKDGVCELSIRMKKLGGQIHIIIEDNGRGIGRDTLKRLNDADDVDYDAEHMGVVNVRKRLKLYYADEAAIYFESEQGSYTKVHLFIPAMTIDKNHSPEMEEGNKDI